MKKTNDSISCFICGEKNAEYLERNSSRSGEGGQDVICPECGGYFLWEDAENMLAQILNRPSARHRLRTRMKLRGDPTDVVEINREYLKNIINCCILDNWTIQ